MAEISKYLAVDKKVEIEELANLIVKATNSSSTITRNRPTSNDKSDIYFAEDDSFEKLFQKNKLEYSNLKAQIDNVINAASKFA